MKSPIAERKCKPSDYIFFRNLIKKTLSPYVTQYAPFSFKHVQDSFKKTMEDVRILMKGKKRIGLYQLTARGKELEITRIFIIPSYQRKGIGLSYMKYFERLGFSHLTLQVWDNNPARLFYKKLGYKEEKTKNHKIFMRKVLK